MQNLFHFSGQRRLYAILLAALVAARSAWGCACGCDIFDVGTSSMFPNHAGWMVFIDYDFQDQNQNWSGTRRVSSTGLARQEKLKSGFRFQKPLFWECLIFPA